MEKINKNTTPKKIYTIEFSAINITRDNDNNVTYITFDEIQESDDSIMISDNCVIRLKHDKIVGITIT